MVPFHSLTRPSPKPLEPVNVTFGERIFADIIKGLKVRSSWIRVGI